MGATHAGAAPYHETVTVIAIDTVTARVYWAARNGLEAIQLRATSGALCGRQNEIVGAHGALGDVVNTALNARIGRPASQVAMDCLGRNSHAPRKLGRGQSLAFKELGKRHARQLTTVVSGPSSVFTALALAEPSSPVHGSRVANRIREIRDRLGVTQQKLADDLGENFQNISRWERGERPIRLDDVERIASALKVRPGSLIDETVEPFLDAKSTGQIVEDSDELTLLAFWRALGNREARVGLLSLLRSAAMTPSNKRPKIS